MNVIREVGGEGGEIVVLRESERFINNEGSELDIYKQEALLPKYMGFNKITYIRHPN